MIPFEVTILGSSSATPTSNRHPTSQILNFRDRFFLIDCGEGAQQMIRRLGFRFGRIDRIFISHVHGDHIFGLPGLLSSLQLLGRDTPLHLHAPKGLMEAIYSLLNLANSRLNYELILHELPAEDGVVFESDYMRVDALILNHSVDCWGFVFREKPNPRKINAAKIDLEEVPIHVFHKLKNGEDVELEDGRRFKNEELTLDPPLPRSYAYFTDTRVVEQHAAALKGVDLLYHEATFLNVDKARAKDTKHSTCTQAADFAKKAEAKKLLLGHFSARYRKLEELEKEARKVFPKSYLATEGKTFKL